MSWFGETFSDGLTSLKGQLTKITKEVLADEENDNNTESDSRTKEFEELCKSKDSELSSLRDEFNKLHNQYKSELEFLKNENQNLKACNNAINLKKCEFQEHEYNQLKEELVHLKEERNHLNFCLDELQAEHQVNLNQVISVRDKYKEDFENLKKEYNSVKDKLNELLENKKTSFSSSEKDSDINENGSEKRKSLKNESCCCDELKLQLEKLQTDIKVLNEGKSKTEEENKLLKLKIESLKSELSTRNKNFEAINEKLSKIVQENKDNIKKIEVMEKNESEMTNMKKNYSDTQKKLKDMLKIFNTVVDEDFKQNNLNVLNFIEDKWKNYQKEKEEAIENLNFIALDLEREYKKVKEEKEKLNCELKAFTEKSRDMEKKYIEEISDLKNKILEVKKQQENCITQSQTDDMKRLEQEVVHLNSIVKTKSSEIVDCLETKNNLEQELNVLKSISLKMEQELLHIREEKEKLNVELKIATNREKEINFQKENLAEKIRVTESSNLCLNKINNDLKTKIQELEKELNVLKAENNRNETLEREIEKTSSEKKELENAKAILQKELDHLKAQLIIKDTNLVELLTKNTRNEEEKKQLLTEIKELEVTKKDIQKWKSASVDLDIQRERLIREKEEVEQECTRLKSELELLALKDNEILQLKQSNTNLIDSCNKLHYELETKVQAELLQINKLTDFESKYNKQLELISDLQEENSELKSRIHKFQEQMKSLMNINNPQINKDEIQQHRRSRSAVDLDCVPCSENLKSNTENSAANMLQQQIIQEQCKYRLLHQRFQEISEKEASARKEFERLKQHLIEIEDHYTEEAIENEKIINDLKAKVMAAEEQLKNSSTLYTSVKVRDNQHLESLQSQVRMVSTQRDDLQAKLSAAEDEVQKHKASLMSLQIVLEQFQQDKEREIEGIVIKYEKQLQITQSHFEEFKMEIEVLKKQLTEAKNGLKAASRLGEQLEKKTQQVIELEEQISQLYSKVTELETSLATTNQFNNGKVDKSLIKNLVVGYVLSPNGDRKSQVLKIMASVLDFDQDERNKMQVDTNNSSWLSNILHPKPGTSSNNQSLSEAFIKFLESESKPQPQLKLLPEPETKNFKPSNNSNNIKPTGVFSELMLPTFNSSQESESSVILKSVLKDS